MGIEEQATELNLIKNYYRYIIDFLESDASVNEFSFPTLTGVEDELVSKLADQLITLSTSLDFTSIHFLLTILQLRS